jgi:uncharacterized protein (UPF0335 family)
MAKSKDRAGNETAVVGGNAGPALRALVERIERLDAQRKSLGEDRKEILHEAKGMGFDTKVMNYVIKLRKMDKDDLDEFETLVEVYTRAIEGTAEDL